MIGQKTELDRKGDGYLFFFAGLAGFPDWTLDLGNRVKGVLCGLYLMWVLV